jgi:hypothetical protein
MNSSEVQPLMADIRRAFEHVSRGSGVTISEARAMDDWEPESVQRAARLLDTETRWQDISDEKLVKYHDTFAFLDAEGMRFYVAAFLLYDLGHPETGWSMGDSVLSSLGRDDRLGLGDYEIFDAEQKAILARYLKLRADDSEDPIWAAEAEKALGLYWQDYLP